MPAKRKLSTLADIRRLIGEPSILEVAGLRLRLTPPTAAAALEVRERMFASVEEVQQAGVMLTATALAVKACLDLSLDDEEAMQLVLRTGGERGPLALQALELCGLGHMLAEAARRMGEEGEASTEAANPTPFSSPARPDAA